MFIKFLYVLWGVDIMLALVEIERSGFDGAWLQIFNVILVAVAIIINDRER